jgi:hypothetical protein
MSSGTSLEPSVSLWGDGNERLLNARFVSDVVNGRQADIAVETVDLNDGQGPTGLLHGQVKMSPIRAADLYMQVSK